MTASAPSTLAAPTTPAAAALEAEIDCCGSRDHVARLAVHLARAFSDAAAVFNVQGDLIEGVVAEGIENSSHITLLRELGCDVGQGFHISQPLQAVELTKWLETSDWHVACRDSAPAAESA